MKYAARITKILHPGGHDLSAPEEGRISATGFPRPDRVEIQCEDRDSPCVLVRYTVDGTFCGDTWHETFSDAVDQATFEYGLSAQDFVEVNISAWQQAGRVYLWRYTENVRNFPGWHLAADETGYTSLLDLIGKLHCSPPGTYRTVRIERPTPEVLAVPNNRRSPVVTPERARFSVDQGDDGWRFDEADSILTISIGMRRLDGLSRWLAQPSSAFDSTYGQSPPLWFWGIISLGKGLP